MFYNYVLLISFKSLNFIHYISVFLSFRHSSGYFQLRFPVAGKSDDLVNIGIGSQKDEC